MGAWDSERPGWPGAGGAGGNKGGVARARGGVALAKGGVARTSIWTRSARGVLGLLMFGVAGELLCLLASSSAIIMITVSKF